MFFSEWGMSFFSSPKVQSIAATNLQRYIWVVLVPIYQIPSAKLLFDSSYTERAFHLTLAP